MLPLRRTTAVILSVLFATGVGGFFSIAQAQQTSPVQQVLDSVKQSLDDLVVGKDQSSSNDVGLRIETFGKVIDFSAAEAQDLKTQLLNYDEGGDTAAGAWKSGALNSLQNALDYYEKEKEWLNDYADTLDLAGIRKVAQDFKTWRDTNFIDVAGQIRDFLLIDQESQAIAIASNRLKKVGDGISALGQLRPTSAQTLNRLLKTAGGLIQDASNLDQEAHDSFWAMNILPPVATSSATSSETSAVASSTATSTPSLSVSTSTTSSTQLLFFTTTSTPTSTAETATSTNTSSTAGSILETITTTSTATSTSPVAPPSVESLVNQSLGKLQKAYQTFLEMSTVARGLFQ